MLMCEGRMEFLGFHYPRQESNDPRKTSGKRAAGNRTARQTAHFSQDLPADLARVVAAWPTLPEKVRAAILAEADSATASASHSIARSGPRAC
jgi:hypothetical protein